MQASTECRTGKIHWSARKEIPEALHGSWGTAQSPVLQDICHCG